MIKHFFLFVFILSLSASNKAQDESGSFFAGINVGGLLANKQTAIMYTGASNIARYGIEDIFANPYYNTAFTNYFQYPYAIVGLTYKYGDIDQQWILEDILEFNLGQWQVQFLLRSELQ